MQKNGNAGSKGNLVIALILFRARALVLYFRISPLWRSCLSERRWHCVTGWRLACLSPSQLVWSYQPTAVSLPHTLPYHHIFKHTRLENFQILAGHTNLLSLLRCHIITCSYTSYWNNVKLLTTWLAKSIDVFFDVFHNFLKVFVSFQFVRDGSIGVEWCLWQFALYMFLYLLFISYAARISFSLQKTLQFSEKNYLAL